MLDGPELVTIQLGKSICPIFSNLYRIRENFKCIIKRKKFNVKKDLFFSTYHLVIPE